MQLSIEDQSRYDRICASVRAAVRRYPSALRALCEPALAPLFAGEFSQLAALLPTWLSDLVPLDDQRLLALGEAGLWLWHYADAFDGMLDGDTPPAALPGAQQALLRAIAIYGGLGLPGTPAWDDLHACAMRSADAYARELATRGAPLPELSDAQLGLWGHELLIDRAAPFSFTLSAQLQLAGAAADDPRRPAIAGALGALTAARQIADDASDWLADLARGQLNSVSAGLIRHLRGRRPDQSAALSPEQLAGYEIQAEDYWDQLEREHASLCAQALDLLRPYGDCKLRGLILRQQRSDEAGWGRLRTRRQELRDLFGA